MLKNFFSKNKEVLNNFKEKFSHDKRSHESGRIMEKYPDRVPIILEQADDTLVQLDKKKYLVPKDITMGQFIYVLRKKLKLGPSIGIFLFFNNNIMVNGSATILDSYIKYKDEDGFLYIKYSGENTFG